MNVETLQEELASEQRTLDFLVRECHRLTEAAREARAVSAEQESTWAREQFAVNELALREQLIAMERRLAKQRAIVQHVRDRIEDHRLQQISNLQMFDRLSRVTAEVIPFPSNDHTPEAA